jgi:antitoxin ParD1/3/4
MLLSIEKSDNVGFNRADIYFEKANPMRTTQSLSITLPLEMAQMVKEKVRSGEYATESEVIRDGLRTLAARDAAVEKWLRDEVAPTFDAVLSGEEKTESAEETLRKLRKHMDLRIAKSNTASSNAA